jgi:hypothetical protein
MEPQDNFAPYAPTENVLRVLSKARAGGLRGGIDNDFLIQLGINDSMAPRTLRALAFLGFINGDGTPTDDLRLYVEAGDEEATAILRQVVLRSYAIIFRAVNPTEDTRVKIYNAFRTMRPQGQWDRMTTLFLGLCRAAGMDVKEAPPNRGARAEASRDQAPRPRTRLAGGPRKVHSSQILTRPKPTPIGLDLQQFYAPPTAGSDPAIESFIVKLRSVETLAELSDWYNAFTVVFQYVKTAKPTVNEAQAET